MDEFIDYEVLNKNLRTRHQRLINDGRATESYAGEFRRTHADAYIVLKVCLAKVTESTNFIENFNCSVQFVPRGRGLQTYFVNGSKMY
jgi:hypothetical protein